MNYRFLSKPVKIGTMELKNSIVMTAISLMYAEAGPEGGYVNDQFRNFYFERAQGGVSMIIVGGVATDNHVGYPHMLRLDEDRYLPGFTELAEGIHKRGAKMCVQLLQTGRYGMKAAVYGDDSTISASAVPTSFSPDVPREMTTDEIHEVIEKAAKAAIRAKKAGADAVEICANSGYLISQFLSPFTNHRTDEYGGDFDHRCRFGLEMIQAIRQAVGEDYPVILRVAGNEYIRGGNGLAESIAFCQKAEKAGVNAIDVTGGWHETIIPQLPADVPEGMFVYLAEAIKASVSIPVISSNRHNNPREAESVLASGQADIIGECRTLIADPQWPNKVLSGRENEIRRCLACNQGCFANVFAHKPCKCLFNSYVGRDEKEHEIQPAETKKKILVIGAGPGGCEFAFRAAARGHQVTIWEKDDRICSKIEVAAAPPAKYEFHNIPAFYSAMLKKYGVNVVLNKNAKADEIAQAGFDEVVTASGSTAKRIKLDGAENIPTFTAEEILSGKEMAGRNVLVVGGGSVGCEAADYMAHEAALSPEKLYFMVTQGTDKPEEIMTMANRCSRRIVITDIARIGANYDFGCGWPIMKDMKRLGVKMYAKSKILEIKDGMVRLETFNKKTKTTEEKTYPVDTIVLAVGYAPADGLFKELSDKGVSVHNLGDSAKIGKIMDAIREADDLASQI